MSPTFRELFYRTPPATTAARRTFEVGAGTTPYGEAVLVEECAIVAHTAPGGRNAALNLAAFKVSRKVPHEIDPADAFHGLLEAGRAAGLPETEVTKVLRVTAGSAYAVGQENQVAKLDLPDVPDLTSYVPALPASDLPAPGRGAVQGVQAVDDREEPATVDFLERMVAAEHLRMKARARALERLRADDDALLVDDGDSGTLRELLQREPEPPARVAGLLPANGRAVLVAARKTGKTTATLNLARCLLTGEAFLGTFGVRPLEAGQRVGVLNYEVSGHQWASWAVEAGLDPDRVWVRNLRGRRNPLTTSAGRAALVAELQAARVAFLIVDPFGRAFPGENQDSNSEVGRWLAQVVDPTLEEAGVQEAVLVVHAGWNGERSRGASALEDWPDAIWRLTRRGGEEEDGTRYFSAEGRDVDVPEDAVRFDQATRTLTLTGAGGRRASRTKERHADLLAELLPLIVATPGIWGRELERQLAHARGPGASRPRSGAVGRALAYGEETGVLTSKVGARRALNYYPAPTAPSDPHRSPVVPGTSPMTAPVVPPPFRGGSMGTLNGEHRSDEERPVLPGLRLVRDDDQHEGQDDVLDGVDP